MIGIKCNVIVSIKDQSDKESNQSKRCLRDIKEPFAIIAALFVPNKNMKTMPPRNRTKFFIAEKVLIRQIPKNLIFCNTKYFLDFQVSV